MSRQARDSSSKLVSVQMLRAVAALLVVVGHVVGTVENMPDRLGTIPHIRYAGGAGVDVFFVISGFIMVFASNRMFGRVSGSWDFMLRRLVRIAPPYWAATMMTLALLAFRPGAFPSIAAVAASFSFIPFDTTGRMDGFAIPVFDLGWTLNYEMMFYVVFALFIPLGRGRCIAAVVATMVLLVGLGHFLRPSTLAIEFWTRPIILEFAAGMLVGFAFTTERLVLGSAARIMLIVLAVALYILDPCKVMGQAMTPNDFARVGGWGVPSLLLLIAAVSGPTRVAFSPARLALLLGDASYVLYLLHPFVLIVMLQLFGRLVPPTTGTAIVFIITTIALACFGAIVAHKLVERPFVAWLTRALQRRGAPIGAVPMPADTTL